MKESIYFIRQQYRLNPSYTAFTLAWCLMVALSIVWFVGYQFLHNEPTPTTLTSTTVNRHVKEMAVSTWQYNKEMEKRARK